MATYTPRSPNDGSYMLFCRTLADVAIRVLSEQQQQDQEQRKGAALPGRTEAAPTTTSNAKGDEDGPHVDLALR